MELTINGEPVDLQLEGERTLGELLEGVESWLETRGRSVSSVTVNGVAVGVDGLEAACALDLAEVQDLRLLALSDLELYLEALSELDGFLDAASVAATGSGAAGSAFRAAPAGSFLALRDQELFRAAESALSGTLPVDGRTAAIEAARGLVALRRGEAEDLGGALEAARAGLIPLAERLESLPLDIQTGKNGEAARTLLECSALIGTVLRISSFAGEVEGFPLAGLAVEDVTLGPFLEGLTSTMKELVSAHESGDGVLVGDIAEYELAPRLRALEAALREAGPPASPEEEHP